jgi:preprotein translocase subunit SecG
MEKAKDIKEELLKQMDGDSAGATDVSTTSARQIIEKHKARLKRLKWIAAISWLITIIYALAMHSLKDYLTKHNIEAVLTDDEFMLVRYSDMGLAVLIIIALLLTYLVYSTSRSTTILQICARLAGIEEQLKKISENV